LINKFVILQTPIKFFKVNLLRVVFFPFAVIYGIITFVRNKLYDLKILKSYSFDFPVISVGNLSVGGTGKTPHIEYIIRLLKENYSVCTLSRGYKRKTKGFVLADNNSNALQIGDEPMQFKNKFDDIRVAVDEDRVDGIKKLKDKYPDIDVFLLDDAFQHRKIAPGLSILITSVNKLYTEDYLLPTGSLRESISGANRADIIIVTKTDKFLSPITKRRIYSELKPKFYQNIYFSYVKYGKILPLPSFDFKVTKSKFNTILLFTGIADSTDLQYYLKEMCNELIFLRFPDHHYYTKKNIELIRKTNNDIYTKNKIIITTEKDAMRLTKSKTIDFIKDLQIFYIPIEIEFKKNDKKKFNKQILDYVEENKPIR